MNLSPYERVTFLGKTRSGKTFASRFMLRLAVPKVKRDGGRVYIVATKRVYPPDFRKEHFAPFSFSFHSNIRAATRAKTDVVVWQPNREELLNGKIYFDAFYQWILERSEGRRGKPALVLTDEAVNVTEGAANGGPVHFRLLYGQGGGMRVGAWSGQQDASFIQRQMLSQAEHYFVFPLRMATDRKKIGDIADVKIPATYPDKRGFYYIGPEGTVYFRDIQTAVGQKEV
jgi:hypothetical protein